MLAIGLMSGTSMDGIDAAILQTNGIDIIKEPYKHRGIASLTYDPEFKILLKTAEYLLYYCQGDLAQANKSSFSQAIIDYLQEKLGIISLQLEQKFKLIFKYMYSKKILTTKEQAITLQDIITHSTKLHIALVNNLLQLLNLHATDLDVIGYHGQTLFHNPAKKITVQVGDGQLLANKTGITVVNNFRQLDINNGGQGAPLASLYHQALAIRDNKFPVVVVNCGGIANVTLITGGQVEDVIGFDTGPGNGLVDRYIRKKTLGQKNMDQDGEYGTKGVVHLDLIKILYKKAVLSESGDNYFNKLPPKSLDLNDLQLIPELDSISLNDAVATLEAFTADTIVNSLEQITNVNPYPKHWILCGGGWYNPVIKSELSARLIKKFSDLHVNNNFIIETADQAAWSNQGMEAQVFAYLAVRRLKNLPTSLPTITGVSRPVSAGDLYQPITCPL